MSTRHNRLPTRLPYIVQSLKGDPTSCDQQKLCNTAALSPGFFKNVILKGTFKLLFVIQTYLYPLVTEPVELFWPKSEFAWQFVQTTFHCGAEWRTRISIVRRQPSVARESASINKETGERAILSKLSINRPHRRSVIHNPSEETAITPTFIRLGGWHRHHAGRLIDFTMGRIRYSHLCKWE